MWRADDDLAIAGAELDDAEDLTGALDYAALDADDMVAMAREKLRAAEWRAAYGQGRWLLWRDRNKSR